MSGETRRPGNFIDSVRIYIKAGDGGDGCLSFRREKFVPFGGPNGGDGGKGGDVYFQADRNLTTLLELSYNPHIKGLDGSNGSSYNKAGRDAKDITVKVPCGTIVRRNGQIVVDMSVHGTKVLIAKGGAGGRGNLAFRTHYNNAPKISEKGEHGQDLDLALELKVLADVGLVGFPNAGKSTFLSMISSARPKIADYPFTTLSPNLGMVFHKRKSFVAADIPGLIAGAHEGRGLGDTFLRHLERTKVLVHLVDPAGFDNVDPVESVKVIAAELRKFSPELSRKPRIIIVNKSDIPGSDKVFAAVKKKFRDQDVFLMSAATGDGTVRVMDEIVRLLDETAREEATRVPEIPSEPVRVVHVMDPAFRVKRGEDGILEITGREVERLIEQTNFGQPESVLRLRNIFHKIGLDKALLRQKVAEGELVRVSDMEFQWDSAAGGPPARSVSRRKRKPLI